ncbi:MAG: anaerobic ribonucleoside-triphosphate reductase [Acutalibacteraceae bacterium]|nr:anaerobic ribonucleoside-triphosphate reductase [Acutalibacteraceae bacterium]
MTDIKVTVQNGELSQEEIDAYIAYGHEKYNGKTIKAMDIKVDGEYVDIDYTFEPVKFDRIRRITGYLVGTTERFNNAKKAEEQDRVKHSIDTGIMEQI